MPRLRCRLPQLMLLFTLLLTLPLPAAIAQSDSDGDGIFDTADNCPASPANNSAFTPESNYYGCPDADLDTVADYLDQCPNEAIDPTASNTGAPLGCPITAGPAPLQNTTGDQQCLVAFSGNATYAQPNTSATVLNDNPASGTYIATARTSDSTWWLLNGTDWVQGTPQDAAACNALPIAATAAQPQPTEQSSTTNPQCLVAFDGDATYAEPSTSAAVVNSSPSAGIYIATERTSDNGWWLLNGTDWVQATAMDVTPGCAALTVFTQATQQPPTPAVSPTAAAQCLIAFNGTATYAQPSTSAPVVNSSPTPGSYAATARTADNRWWLLNGTDWVQGTPVAGTPCNTLQIFTGQAQPVQPSGDTCETHTVAAGETLFRIAQQYDLSANALASFNDISNPNSITVGQRLNIPCPEGISPVAVTPEASIDFAPPTSGINPTTAATVTALFDRSLNSIPLSVAWFRFDQPDDSAAVLTQDGLLSLYSVLAPDTTPGSETGDYQKIYKLASNVSGALATAERNANDDGSIIRIWGYTSGSLDETFDILPNPLTDALLSSIAITDGFLASSADYPPGTAAPTQQFGVRLWSLTEFGATELGFVPLSEPALGIAFNADGSRFATATSDGMVQIWDVAALVDAPTSPVAAASFSDGPSSVSRLGGSASLAFSPDGTLIAVGGGDGQVRVWDITTGELATALPYQADAPILSVVFSPDGSVLATAGGLHPDMPDVDPTTPQDNTVYLWDVEAALAQRPSQLAALIGHTGAVLGLAFNNNGTILTSVGADSTWRLWGIA